MTSVRGGRIPLTPALLIATAGAFLDVRETGTSNSGPMVDRFLRLVGLRPGQPWCAAFVSYAGHWSHHDHLARRSSWPLPLTGSCWVLGDHAARRGILEREPAPGDVFLIHSPALGRFGHAGVVVAAAQGGTDPDGSPWFECVTIEGNTNEDGSRDGTTVLRKTRRIRPGRGDRFIRWVRLGAPEERAAAA